MPDIKTFAGLLGKILIPIAAKSKQEIDAGARLDATNHRSDVKSHPLSKFSRIILPLARRRA
jgi:hypothetical protein